MYKIKTSYMHIQILYYRYNLIKKCYSYGIYLSFFAFSKFLLLQERLPNDSNSGDC